MLICLGIVLCVIINYSTAACPRNKTFTGTQLEYVFLGCSVELLCNTRQPVDMNYPLMWILPDKSVIEKNDNSTNIAFIKSNGNLHIAFIDIEHEGQFICVTNNKDHFSVGFAFVSLAPRYDYSEKNYEIRIVTGTIAASVILATFTIGCLIYRFRSKDYKPNKDYKQNKVGRHLASTSGYDNPAMLNNELSKSVKEGESNLEDSGTLLEKSNPNTPDKSSLSTTSIVDSSSFLKNISSESSQSLQKSPEQMKSEKPLMVDYKEKTKERKDVVYI